MPLGVCDYVFSLILFPLFYFPLIYWVTREVFVFGCLYLSMPRAGFELGLGVNIYLNLMHALTHSVITAIGT